MLTLRATFLDYDLDLLKIIANRWDVDLTKRDVRGAGDQLAEAMLDPQRAAHEWSRLNDRERGALQVLLGAKEHKMALSHYSRLFGEIRQMGQDRRAREKPHLNPVGMAETLFYRGLAAVTYDQGKTGAQAFIYVPSDLAAVLPSHETGYDLSQPVEGETYELEAEAPDRTRRADTSLVDDLTTILAYLQIERVTLHNGTLATHDRQALEDYLLGTAHPTRIALIVALIAGLGLAAETEGLFRPVRDAARKWLEQPRTRQVKSLVQSWQSSTLFNELHYVPGIVLESAGWKNDPTLIRQTLQSFLAHVPHDQWFAIPEFIGLVKEEEPDFQRPSADYDTWYIRDANTDEYLRGFESWDQVDGAVLRVTLTEPMHWLGLLDIGESAAGITARLTAYGRAFAGINDYPDQADAEGHITVEADGTIFISRKLSRYNRFQLARFTEWGAPGDDYEYRISTGGFAQAEAQGIKAEHITTFLKRTAQTVPQNIFTLIDQWSHTTGAPVTIRRLVVLETESEDTLQVILNTPDLRRYVGSQLGVRAVVVRAGQWDELIAALQKRGLLVEHDL